MPVIHLINLHLLQINPILQEEANKEESPAPAAAPEAAPAPAPAEEKKDEAAADQDPKKEEPPAADPPSPPPPVPVILGVEVHCTGCAKRIRRSLLRCKGVEAVHVDMSANQVTIKGAVDPQALCDRLRAKTKRDATLISPLPPPPPAEGEEPPPPPPPAPPLVSEARTVELLVNMHCEACAQQLQTKMMRMKGPAADAEPPKDEAPADGKKEEAGDNKAAEDGKGAA
uniref:HMA domain-containing protein n=1 Tax=Aegilops tauschii subsp. strangulata TaxID=200361 RepID=A0A453MMU5_AEGTS